MPGAPWAADRLDQNILFTADKAVDIFSRKPFRCLPKNKNNVDSSKQLAGAQQKQLSQGETIGGRP
jgi:hypothetical protein